MVEFWLAWSWEGLVHAVQVLSLPEVADFGLHFWTMDAGVHSVFQSFEALVLLSHLLHSIVCCVLECESTFWIFISML